MPQNIPDILARIAGQKRIQLEAKRARRSEWEAAAEANRGSRRDFRAALLADPPAVIAEIKRASPSRGVIAGKFDPAATAAAYHRGGAAALSVLTDEEFFGGSMNDLRTARAQAPLPVLRKDFTVDEIDVVEAAAAGADAILLIAALLAADEIERLRVRAEKLGLAALVEVHDADELARVLDTGATIIGVNNRDLRTFEVRLETAIELAPKIPSRAVRVAESGIHSAADLARLAAAGYQAFLVGEHLMKSGDAESALRGLRGVAP